MGNYLSPEAEADFQAKVKEYNVPESEWDCLRMGVFYLWEWKRIASEVADQTINVTAHDKGNNADRLNPVLRHMETCKKSWFEVAYAYGINPLGKKKVGITQEKSPKEKRKTKTTLRKIVNE